MNQVDSRNGCGHDDSNTNTDNGMIIITKCVRNVNKISHKVVVYDENLLPGHCKLSTTKQSGNPHDGTIFRATKKTQSYSYLNIDRGFCV